MLERNPRFDQIGPDVRVNTREPVDRLREFARHMVQRAKVLCVGKAIPYNLIGWYRRRLRPPIRGAEIVGPTHNHPETGDNVRNVRS